jgi:transposase
MKETVAWLGLDAHARSCVLGQLDDQGNRVAHWALRTTESDLIRQVQAIPAAVKRLAVEECGLGRWIAQTLRPHVTQVVVCDPHHNRLISRHPHKCDVEDAYQLAALYRLGALKAVWQPTEDHRAVFKTAAQAYLESVVRQTALKLQLKAHYRHWGVMPTGSRIYSKPGRESWLAQVPSSDVQAQLRLLHAMVDAAVEGERASRRLLVRLGQRYPEIGWLRTLPGIGVIGAHVFVAFIQNPARFATMSALNRYCRLGVRERSSDGKPLGYQQLDRRGHGALKAISYRAWLMAMKRQRGAVWESYQQSLERTGDATHARLNTQRKVLWTMIQMWRRKEVFDAEKFLGTAPQHA